MFHTFASFHCSLAVEYLGLEIIGIEVNLLLIEAEFFVEQHIKNPLKTTLGNFIYLQLNIITNLHLCKIIKPKKLIRL